MNIFFLDCETTGVPIDYKASYTDVDNWPRVISLAWILARQNSTVISEQHKLIKPDGWQMPTDPFWSNNGFTQERSLAHGYRIRDVLTEMMEDLREATVLVAHNINFDHRIVWAELIRAGMEPRSGMHKICTMIKGTSLCQIPGVRYGYKWPKLEELYEFLFQKPMEGAHNAKTDVTATKDCFFEMLKRNAVQLPAEVGF